MSVEDAEKEQRNQDHEDKVADEDVIPAVGEILPQLCGTEWYIAADCVVVLDTSGGVVESFVEIVVACIKLKKSWNVPERC